MDTSRQLDFYHYDDGLTSEERSLRDRVREWVSSRFMPHVQDAWNRHDFPMELVKEMAELGCFGATIEGYGCPGISNRAYGVVMRELERGDSGLAHDGKCSGGAGDERGAFLRKRRTTPAVVATNGQG